MSTSVHGDKTRGDDNAILILEFDNGVVALAEESWTKLGGMDDRAEVHGSDGVAYADLLHGNAIQTYSAKGYDYAVEKAGYDQRLELHDLRGDLELRLSAGVGPFRRLRPARPATAGDRSRTARRCWRSCSLRTSPPARAAKSCCRPRQERTSPAICGRSVRRSGSSRTPPWPQSITAGIIEEMSRQAAALVIAAADSEE